MEWKFKRGDILVSEYPAYNDLVEIYGVFVAGWYSIDDELRYRYDTQDIGGRHLFVTQKTVEHFYIKIGDKEFKEFFDLFCLSKE